MWRESVPSEDAAHQGGDAAGLKIEGRAYRKVVHISGVCPSKRLARCGNPVIDGPHEPVGQDWARQKALRETVFVGADARADARDLRRAVEVGEKLPHPGPVHTGVEVGDVRSKQKALADMLSHVGKHIPAGYTAMAVGVSVQVGCKDASVEPLLESAHLPMGTYN